MSLDPTRGGKITELVHRSMGRNLLLSEEAVCDMPLDDGAVFAIAGWDECVPSIEACAGIPVLGHAWRMNVEAALSQDNLNTFWRMPGWTLERGIETNDTSLTARYALKSDSDKPASVLWASHVMYPLAGLVEAVLPPGEPVVHWRCNLDELKSVIEGDSRGWFVRNTVGRGNSWKFFLPAEGDVVLRYTDAVLTLSTDAPWWGIWLNLGHKGIPCIGVEPTNVPTDSVNDVLDIVPPRGMLKSSWSIRVDI
ncbi:MAG: hypothetical protein ACYC64_05945 [Armatimonadota bacterium]